jgi:hypothetical protein
MLTFETELFSDDIELFWSWNKGLRILTRDESDPAINYKRSPDLGGQNNQIQLDPNPNHYLLGTRGLFPFPFSCSDPALSSVASKIKMPIKNNFLFLLSYLLIR